MFNISNYRLRTSKRKQKQKDNNFSLSLETIDEEPEDTKSITNVDKIISNIYTKCIRRLKRLLF